MENERKKTYELLSQNAVSLREILSKKDFNLAEADRLFRERNQLFYSLKDVFLSNDVSEEELSLIKAMIDDNKELLEQIEKKKEEMEKNFKKKESDARKITSYLKG